MAWLLMMLVFLFVVTRFAGVCLRLTDRSLPRCCEGRRSLNREAEIRPPQMAPKAETPLEALQRRFAEGQISLEHYEREVGRLFGLKSLGPSGSPLH